MQQNLQKEKTILKRQNKMTRRQWNEAQFFHNIDPVIGTLFRAENSRVIPHVKSNLGIGPYQNKR